jgi:hypothetical protein
VSEDANIKALGEKVRISKNKLHFLEFFVKLLILLFVVWGILTALVSFYLVGVGGMGLIVGLLNIFFGPLIFIGLVKLVVYKMKKLEQQEDESKKRLLTLLYPAPNCYHCGKPLIEGNKFCTYCGNTRHS